MPAGIINTASVNVRDVPDGATVNAVLAKGSPVDVITSSDDGKWLMIAGEENGLARFGWIQAQFVTVGSPPTVPAGPGKTNPKYPGVLFTALVPGGFFSSDPDDLGVLRAIRTNNPGALNDSSWQHARAGYVGKSIADSHGNRTAIYSAPEYGVASWRWLLSEVYKFKDATNPLTVSKLARKYAGSGAPQSAVDAYVNGWCKLADPDLTSDATVPLEDETEMVRLGLAMFKHESRAIVKISEEQIRFGIRNFRNMPEPPKPS